MPSCTSRQALWRKGEISGEIQILREMRNARDRDIVPMSVDVGGDGGTCHRGFQNYFYRMVEVSEDSQSRRDLESVMDWLQFERPV